jgi:hypothetical protein
VKLLSQKTIRFTAFSSALVALSLAGLGCNSSDNNNPGSAPVVQKAPQGPAWQLVYQADAGSNDKTQVVGAYGFTINADGTYVAGPGPQGQTLKGNLSSDEFTAIQTALQPVISGDALAQTQTCGPSQIVESSDTLTFIHQASTTTFLNKSMDGTVCSNGFDTQSAEDLHDLVVAAASNYYALPFPSACLDSANAVQALYAGLSACSQDSDCAYLDQNYNAIDAATSETVYVDSCSVVQALPVANASAVQANLTALQTALVTAQSTCGGNIVRSGCTSTISFSSIQAAPVCLQGACHVNPALQF